MRWINNGKVGKIEKNPLKQSVQDLAISQIHSNTKISRNFLFYRNISPKKPSHGTSALFAIDIIKITAIYTAISENSYSKFNHL